ncbi:hypothetical protein AAVH_40690, partial [Aphelenchoides avenae]
MDLPVGELLDVRVVGTSEDAVQRAIEALKTEDIVTRTLKGIPSLISMLICKNKAERIQRVQAKADVYVSVDRADGDDDTSVVSIVGPKADVDYAVNHVVPAYRTFVTSPEAWYWLTAEGGLRINRITKVSGTEVHSDDNPDPVRKTFTIVGNSEKNVKLAEKLMDIGSLTEVYYEVPYRYCQTLFASSDSNYLNELKKKHGVFIRATQYVVQSARIISLAGPRRSVARASDDLIRRIVGYQREQYADESALAAVRLCRMKTEPEPPTDVLRRLSDAPEL